MSPEEETPENRVAEPVALAVDAPAVESQLAQIVPSEKQVQENAFSQYERLLKFWGPLSIYVSRSTGSPATWLIDSFPPSGAELYAALKFYHAQSPEAEYELRFNSGGQQRGHTYVTLPHMPEVKPQQGQPMHSPPPYGQQPSPQYAQQPSYQQPQYAQPFQQQQPPPAPPPQQPSPSDQWTAFYAMQRQQLELLQEMQRTAAAPHSQQPQPQVQPPPPPASPVMPPTPAVPPPGSPTDQWTAFYAMQRQQLELLQEMQRTAAAGQQSQQPQVQLPVQQPLPMQQPQIQTPPGMIRTDVGFVSAEKLLRVIADDGRPSSSYRAPYAPGPRASYYGAEAMPPDGSQPQYGAPPPGPGYRPGYQPPQPTPREKTPIELMRETLGLSKIIVEMADQIRPPVTPSVSESVETDDESPVRVVDLGGAKGVFNVSDGTTRVLESIVANVPGIFKAAGDAWESARKAREQEQKQREQRMQQLPAGFVEVGPGYVPPKGFVAIPVDQLPIQQPVAQSAPQPARPVAQPQQVLPDPPANMPAPLVEEVEQQQTWTPPSFIPGAGQ